MSRSKLRTRRKSRGLTLLDMVRKINHDGCDVPFLSRFERGLDTSDRISPALVARISEEYGVTIKMVAR